MLSDTTTQNQNPNPAKEINLLANNFVDNDFEQSKYIKSQLASFKANNDIANRQLEMIESLRIQHMNAKTSGDHAKINRQGDVAMTSLRDEDTLDKLDTNLEEMKDILKKEAKKALIAKSKEQATITTDENGNIEIQEPEKDSSADIELPETNSENEIQITSPEFSSVTPILPSQDSAETIVINTENITSIDIRV